MTRTKISLATLVVLALCATPLSAAILQFQANFDGLQMVPPNASPAIGLADATLDDSSGLLTIVTGTYQDLLGGSNQVFLNDAAPGSNGPFISLLTNDTPGAATGTFSGSVNLTNPQMADVIAGNGYIRITSSVFPAGEIRGQLLPVPEPSTVVLMGLGALAIFAVGRRRGRVR